MIVLLLEANQTLMLMTIYKLLVSAEASVLFNLYYSIYLCLLFQCIYVQGCMHVYSYKCTGVELYTVYTYIYHFIKTILDFFSTLSTLLSLLYTDSISLYSKMIGILGEAAHCIAHPAQTTPHNDNIFCSSWRSSRNFSNNPISIYDYLLDDVGHNYHAQSPHHLVFNSQRGSPIDKIVMDIIERHHRGSS